jgi:hypothetical protein
MTRAEQLQRDLAVEHEQDPLGAAVALGPVAATAR